jgi:lipid A disaccharide synthetase
LLSYLKIGERGEEIKNLLVVYAEMFENLNNNLPAFSFFFTHVPEHITIADLISIIEDGFK